MRAFLRENVWFVCVEGLVGLVGLVGCSFFFLSGRGSVGGVSVPRAWVWEYSSSCKRHEEHC